jgi:hypothetical protein
VSVLLIHKSNLERVIHHFDFSFAGTAANQRLDETILTLENVKNDMEGENFSCALILCVYSTEF